MYSIEILTLFISGIKKSTKYFCDTRKKNILHVNYYKLMNSELTFFEIGEKIFQEKNKMNV